MRPVSDGLGRGFGQRVRIDENGRGDPALAQSDTLAEVGDGQRVGAMRHEGGAQLGGAVAVGVGLDDGEDLPLGPDDLADGADVVGGGVEIDLEGGGPHGRRIPGMFRLGIACVGLFVLTSGAMANDITPAVRSELAPIGQAAGRNQSRQLPARRPRILGDRAARCRARPGARARQAAGRAGGVLQVRDGRRARRRRPHRRVGRGVSRRGAPACHRDRVHRGLSRDSRDLSGPRRLADPLARRRRQGRRADRGGREERVRALSEPQHQARQADPDQGHRRLVQRVRQRPARSAVGPAAPSAE